MPMFKVALLQIAPAGGLQENLEKGLAACRKAAAMGADAALFPEMWSNGYRLDGDGWTQDAIALHGPFTQRFAALAAQLRMAIGVTLLEAYPGGPRNTLALFDRHGRLVLTYAKVHTCDFDAERALTPGERFVTADLDTAAGPVRVGAMICYDREFPESARILMLQGAEVVLVPNACPMEINRLSQLRARAFENMMGVATCNYPAGVPDCNGHSSAFDGVAYLPGANASRDTCILEAGGEEGVFLAEFDLARMRAYRGSEVHGNAFRRPRLYASLLSEEVRPPFVRSARRG